MRKQKPASVPTAAPVAAAPRTRAPRGAVQVVNVPRWSTPATTDIIDAEIVSEEKWLS